jgi:manganese transport protein
MYQKILLALEHTETDAALLEHIPTLAGLTRSELLLLHVADGWAARNFDQLQLAASEEMRDDWEYLERTAEELRKQNFVVNIRLALGNPPRQILAVAREEGCDLIAMVSHGHKLLSDIIRGSTIDTVRHESPVPILAIPALKSGKAQD